MKKIQVGRLVNTHGLRGEVKVLSQSDFKEERFKKGSTLFIGDILVTVKSHRVHKNFDLLTFEEFNHINQVEKYKGTPLFVDAETIGDLKEDEFYYHELEGMQVSDGSSVIGSVLEVRENPGNDLLVVKTPNKTILIPFVSEIVKDVNKEENTIIVHVIEGLL